MNRKTYNAAKKTLENNCYAINLHNQLLRRTLPSREFYVHQWNWDSATHAMALIHIDEMRAYEEIYSLLSGQWVNGLIPHIIFNPSETRYFPGPDIWDTEKTSGTTIATSGITQPPLITISAFYMYKTAKDRNQARIFQKNVIPKLVAYHEHLKKYRDPENSGLLTIIHPWESGTDNSPRWDNVLQQIDIGSIPDRIKETVNEGRTDNKLGELDDRPKVYDYYRYLYLTDLYKNWQWDFVKIVRESPFAVKDILFNAIWCYANDSLAQFLEETGKGKDAKKFRVWEQQTRDAIQSLWNSHSQIFKLINVTQGKKISIYEDTIANFLPLLAKAVTKTQLTQLINQLLDPKKYWSPVPLPSIALDNPKFELTRYWRGPSWPITNLLIIEGLRNYEMSNPCKKLQLKIIKKTMSMIEKYGFSEYYNPYGENTYTKRKTLGFGSFSWSAAIYIYLAHEYKLITF